MRDFDVCLVQLYIVNGVDVLLFVCKILHFFSKVLNIPENMLIFGLSSPKALGIVLDDVINGFEDELILSLRKIAVIIIHS